MSWSHLQDNLSMTLYFRIHAYVSVFLFSSNILTTWLFERNAFQHRLHEWKETQHSNSFQRFFLSFVKKQQEASFSKKIGKSLMNVLFSPFSLCSGAVTFCPNGFSSKSIGAPKVMRRHICQRFHIKKRFFHFVITFSYHLIEKDAAPYDQLKYWVTVKGCSSYHGATRSLGPGGRAVRVKSL